MGGSRVVQQTQTNMHPDVMKLSEDLCEIEGQLGFSDERLKYWYQIFHQRPAEQRQLLSTHLAVLARRLYEFDGPSEMAIGQLIALVALLLGSEQAAQDLFALTSDGAQVARLTGGVTPDYKLPAAQKLGGGAFGLLVGLKR